MCRSSAHGGRRCAGSSSRARTRALNTAQRRVQRARHARDAATDPNTAAAAQERLEQARQHLADVHAAHPTAANGGDTTPATDTTEDTMTSHHQPSAGDDHQHHTTDDTPNDSAGSNSSAGQSGDTTAQTTSHIGPNGAMFTNYAAPGATVGLQAHTVIGATVVMGSGPTPAGLPDQVRNLHEQVQSAMAAGRYTAHHSDDITEPGPGTNIAGAGERVAFQVGYVHRRDNT